MDVKVLKVGEELPGYEGSVIVNGRQCKKCGSDFYENIGVDFEYSTMYEKLSARENLQFFSSLYRDKAGRDQHSSYVNRPGMLTHADASYQRQMSSIVELLRMVGLENDADKRVSDYSKGMKSRLMKDMILKEKRRGKTILLTTHNMQAAMLYFRC